MKKGTITLLIIVAVVLICGGYIWNTYNKLVTTNEIVPLIHNIYNPDTILKATMPKDN